MVKSVKYCKKDKLDLTIRRFFMISGSKCPIECYSRIMNELIRLRISRKTLKKGKQKHKVLLRKL